MESLHFSELLQDSPSFSKLFQAFPRFSELLQDSPSFSKILRASPRLSEFLQDSPSFSKLLRASPRFSELLQDSPSFSKILQDSPSFSPSSQHHFFNPNFVQIPIPQTQLHKFVKFEQNLKYLTDFQIIICYKFTIK